MSKSRCITTPIYYVNDRPHIGHVYTTTLCDAWARAMRLSGDEVFFLTGTDEHGLKIQRAADTAGVSPQAFADRVSQDYAKVFQKFGVTHTHFVRTSRFGHQFNFIVFCFS